MIASHVSSAMQPPKEFPAISTGTPMPILWSELSRLSTRFGMFGSVRSGRGGVLPNPAMSKAMTRRLRSRYGVTALQTAWDMPIPCRRINGVPMPLSW